MLPPLLSLSLLALQITLFIGGVLDSEEEVTRLLQPFGPIVRTIVVTNPAVRASLNYSSSNNSSRPVCVLPGMHVAVCNYRCRIM